MALVGAQNDLKYSLADSTRFGEEIYISGSQTQIYIGKGNIKLDEVVSIQFDASQNKMPIYGYASREFDAVAMGTYLVKGIFTINFVSPGYLFSLLKEGEKYNPRRLKDGYTPDNKQNIDTIKKAIKVLKNKPNISEAKQAKKTLRELKYNRGKLSNVARPDLMDYSNNIFNIRIIYGSESEQYFSQRILQDVHITGFGQVIQITGQPLLEQYQFFAKNIKESTVTRDSNNVPKDIESVTPNKG